MKTEPLSKRNNGYIYPNSPFLIYKNFNAYDSITLNYQKILKEFNNTTNHVTNYDDRLRDYQNIGINFILKRKSIAIFDEQRLGKTPMTLVSIRHRKKDIENSIIVIAPKSTLLNWEQEFYKWTDYNKICRIDTAKQTKQQRIKLYNENKQVYIMNYQTVTNDYNCLPKCDCIVIDEAHRLRNFKGMQSKYSPEFAKRIIGISYKCKFKYLLSGTPSPNYPWNIYPLLHIMYPKLFSSYYYFLDYYFRKEDVYTKDDIIEQPVDFLPEKDKELQSFLQIVALQRKRKDYMDWLPSIDEKTITIELDNKNKKWYNELNTMYECKDLNIICQNKLTLIIQLRQLTTKNKLQYVLDYLDDYPNEQIIIASMFTSILKELAKSIKQPHTLCIGETTDEKRKKAEDDFNSKKINILLANIEVIKEGMKLEQCNTMLILDPSLTYTNNEQLKDRMIPTTKEIALQKDKQQIIHILIKDTIDEYIDEQLKLKKSMTEIINNFNNK